MRSFSILQNTDLGEKAITPKPKILQTSVHFVCNIRFLDLHVISFFAQVVLQDCCHTRVQSTCSSNSKKTVSESKCVHVSFRNATLVFRMLMNTQTYTVSFLTACVCFLLTHLCLQDYSHRKLKSILKTVWWKMNTGQLGGALREWTR